MVKRSTELRFKQGGCLKAASDSGIITEITVRKETGQYGEETSVGITLTKDEMEELIEILKEHLPRIKVKKAKSSMLEEAVVEELGERHY